MKSISFKLQPPAVALDELKVDIVIVVFDTLLDGVRLEEAVQVKGVSGSMVHVNGVTEHRSTEDIHSLVWC
ncbi:hypothetical protein WICPIJ_008390 [Wickerhamomyces pijperi]|uniref:Uncharacterized protein n=1 Tax=Wickerhamomyces pijperi TaxID=599730 RepID=A0A9P8PXP4_WICPI|nr:hypothetical protein WICPIJ_008390 [Wickerhamomyces pijperi]